MPEAFNGVHGSIYFCFERPGADHRLEAVPNEGHRNQFNPMRTLTAPLAFLVLSSLTAQVTIQYADLSAFGVATDMHQMLAPAALPALSDGSNQTWDLSGITLQAIGTLNFNTAAGTPYASTYPTANWVWAQNVTGVGTSYTYLAIAASGVDLVARNVPFSTLNYSDPSRVMQFPLAYGGVFSDTYVNDNGSGTVIWTYSGHGTAATPLGTFPDVAKLVSNEGDLLLWNTSPLYPIVIDDGNNVLFFAQNNVGVAEQGTTAVRAYPNPCHERLAISGTTPGTTWQILDDQGRNVAQGSLVATGTDAQVDVSALATGHYMLVLNDNGRPRHSGFIKQ